MKFILKRSIYIFILLLLLGGFSVNKTYAASLGSLSDTITTSRPSTAAPLNANQAIGDTQVQVVDVAAMASPQYLASDSAVLQLDTGQAASFATVASTSALQAGSPTFKWVYFTSTVNPNTAHHKGTAVVVPITATHTVKFTTVSSIPSGGQIIVTFPSGGANNSASPSATAFSFNNELASSITDVICYPVGACSGSKASNQSNTFTFVTSGGAIAGGTTIYINIGCTTAAAGPCTASAPRLINPTKGSATPGSADTWKVSVATTDTPGNGGTVLDTGMAKIATVEAVQVQATVEPSITFSIVGGFDNTTHLDTVGTGCNATIYQNSGITTTATFVNLGLVSNAQVNFAIQQLQVATNGSAGYVITATSSGRFINSANGRWITDANGGNGLIGNDNPAPAIIGAGVEDFGIHACGPRSNINTDQWVNAGNATAAKFSNPWDSGANMYYATLASYSGGPVNTENTAVLYGVAISPITPPGTYSNYFTYVATATF